MSKEIPNPAAAVDAPTAFVFGFLSQERRATAQRRYPPFMARILKVELAVPNALTVQGLVPEFQNFGEDVYRDLRGQCDISLDEVDHFAGAFHLRGLHKRDVRTVAARVRKILEKYHSLTDVKIYEVPDEHDG